MERDSKVLFILATHGDEGFSINPLLEIMERYPREEYGYDYIIGNPWAHREGVRFIEADLNRSAPGDSASSIYEARRAAEIMELSKKYSWIVDIHGSTAECGIVTINPSPTFENILLTAAFPIKRNVIWRAESCLTGSLVQYAFRPGIELECGPKSLKAIQDRLEYILAEFLVFRKIQKSFAEIIACLKDKEFYTVYGTQAPDTKVYKDFILTGDGDDEFYPFLTNQYPGIACLKMRKIDLESLCLLL